MYMSFIASLSDGRKLYKIEMVTACYDTGFEDGVRARPNAFVSSFAPPGTGFADFSFEFRAVIGGMNVAIKLNLLVTPQFFVLQTNQMVYSSEHVNHSLHVGYADSVKNAPEFVGYYLRDDYVCSKQQLSDGTSTFIHPVRLAFCLLTPEASLNPWAGKVVDISVRGVPKSVMFGCQEDSWIDMNDAILRDGVYEFDRDPRVVTGAHEIILWFVVNSDISRNTLPAIFPHNVGDFLDALLVYYDASSQRVVSKSTRDALKIEVLQEIELNCTNQPQSYNIACFRVAALETTLNKKFTVHHDSMAYYPLSKRRSLLSSLDDQLQTLKTGTVLLDTRQSDKTAYVTEHVNEVKQLDATALQTGELSDVKAFQEDAYRQTCVNFPVRIEAWNIVCTPRGRENTSYSCFNASVNITNVHMNEEPLTNMCGPRISWTLSTLAPLALLLPFVLAACHCTKVSVYR